MERKRNSSPAERKLKQSDFLSEGDEKMAERRISIDQIDHTKGMLYETVGISSAEFDSYAQETYNNYTPETLIKHLGFSIGELREAFRNTGQTSKAISNLWEKRGKREISLREFVQTFLLLHQFVFSGPSIAIVIEEAIETKELKDPNENIIKLVTRRGTPVLQGTPVCEAWLETHKDSQGCPSELGCKKVRLILRVLDLRDNYKPKSKIASIKKYWWTMKTINTILKAKDLEELKTISDSIP